MSSLHVMPSTVSLRTYSLMATIPWFLDFVHVDTLTRHGWVSQLLTDDRLELLPSISLGVGEYPVIELEVEVTQLCNTLLACKKNKQSFN